MCNYLLKQFAATLTPMGAPEMTPAEQFAAWLKQAMRDAGFDVDSQRGGGRNELAARMGIAKSTVTRWLSGEVIPAPEYFGPLAAALGVTPLDLLVGAKIIDTASAERARNPDAQRPITPEQAADQLGIPEADRDIFLTMVETLRRRGPGIR